MAATGKKFVLEAHCSDSYADLDGYDCYVLTVNPAYAEVLLRRVELLRAANRQDSAAYELYFWDAAGEFHGRDFDAEELAPSGEPSRTECDQLVVCANELFWTSIPKYTDVYVTTDAIPVAEIEKIARVPSGSKR